MSCIFKQLKSTLGLHHYRFKKFEKAETWVTLLPGDVRLFGVDSSAEKLKQKSLKKKEREWWQAQRTYGWPWPCVRKPNSELKLLAEKMETPAGRKVLAKQLRQSHPKEDRAAI